MIIILVFAFFLGFLFSVSREKISAFYHHLNGQKKVITRKNFDHSSSHLQLWFGWWWSFFRLNYSFNKKNFTVIINEEEKGPLSSCHNENWSTVCSSKTPTVAYKSSKSFTATKVNSFIKPIVSLSSSLFSWMPVLNFSGTFIVEITLLPLFWLFWMLLLLSTMMMIPPVIRVTEAVTVTEVHIMAIKSGRTDYVIAGESVQLSCHYIFTKKYERVIAVTWKKDGLEVYFSTPNKRPLALDLFRGHVDYNSKDLLNTVTLFNIDKSFAGHYSCRVITEYNESENTAHMTVIVDSCKDSNWKTKTDMVNCVEEISFHCIGMYPKPSPACSIHNDYTDQYFAGETFDMIERLPNGTYEIAIQRRYHAANFTKYPGQLSFHCHLLVLMTSWRMGLNYKLFGDSGCVEPPPAIQNGTSRLIGERTCWGTPRENSRINYSCQEQFQLMGPSVLICHNGSWIPDLINLMSQPVTDLRTYNKLKLRMPYCQLKNNQAFQSMFNDCCLVMVFLSISLPFHYFIY